MFKKKINWGERVDWQTAAEIKAERTRRAVIRLALLIITLQIFNFLLGIYQAWK